MFCNNLWLLYVRWDSQGYFKPNLDQGNDPFVISMPPPNVTGSLHMGHAMFVTLEVVNMAYKHLIDELIFFFIVTLLHLSLTACFGCMVASQLFRFFLHRVAMFHILWMNQIKFCIFHLRFSSCICCVRYILIEPLFADDQLVVLICKFCNLKP